MPSLVRLLLGLVMLVLGSRGFQPLTIGSRRIVSASMSATFKNNDGDAQFGTFRIPASSIFHQSEGGSIAFVNLRPILPGHVLVIPSRVAPLMSDLSESEYLDLWSTVRHVQSLLKTHYQATAFNVAVQDGKDSGQSVVHCHVHILPRIGTSDDPYYGPKNDEIYTALEEWSPRGDLIEKALPLIEMPDIRRDRIPEEMAAEATIYRTIMKTLLWRILTQKLVTSN